MYDFLEQNPNVTQIVLACFVANGQGEAVHNNRASYGVAFNVSGKKRYIFDTENELTVYENDIIFLPQYSYYRVESDVPGDCYAINFKISDEAVFKPFVTKMDSTIIDKFKLAEKTYRHKKSGYEIQCKAILYSVIYDMIKSCEKAYIPKKTESIIIPALSYINERYATEKLSVESLSAMCGISTAYFRRIFQKSKGISPVKYINNLKLTRAKELIVSNYYTISEVAGLSGFGDESFFCRFFKKSTGITPSEYRNQHLL